MKLGSLSAYRRRWHYETNRLLSRLLSVCFGVEVSQRRAELEKIENDPVGLAGIEGVVQTGRQAQGEWVAVFVCMVAWPGLPCRLHIFEPRYR